jgi:hypothetical protein
MENIGAATGFPFGQYHFEVDAGLPHVGCIPVIVGPLWFGAGYFSWVVASILLDGADRRLDRPFNVIALPVVAAFVMTQWDLVMDPPESTIAKVWIWHEGGAVIGQTFIRGNAFDAGGRFGVHPDSAILIGRSRNAQISGNTVARGQVTKAAVAVDRTCDMGSVHMENNKLT